MGTLLNSYRHRGGLRRLLLFVVVVVLEEASAAPRRRRGERLGGILKKIAKRLIRQFHVVGKRQMKSSMYVSVETKNDSMRKGGIAPSQWVIAW